MPLSSPHIDHLDHLVLTVASLPDTIRFYTDGLGLTSETFVDAAGQTRSALRFGKTKINLHQLGREFEPKAGLPTPGSADLCFLSQTPLDQWQSHLVGRNIRILEGPIARTGATGPLISIYLRDPDGNLIEISNPVAQATP